LAKARNQKNQPRSLSPQCTVVTLSRVNKRLQVQMVSAALTPATQLFKDRLQLIPERCVARIAVVFGWCRLRDAHGVWRRERIDQTGLKFRMFSRSTAGAFWGSGAFLSIGAGSNFSTI
jgi:hypothetical protein